MKKLVLKARDPNLPFEEGKPDWWDNFMNSLPHGKDTTEEYWYDKRDRHLALYGARLVYDAGQPALQFQNDHDCTVFLMKFA